MSEFQEMKLEDDMAPEGWTVEKIEPEVWRDRFYIRGELWIPEKKYEYDDDNPISIHFEVFACWETEEGLRFNPCNVATMEPDLDYLYLKMSVKWDGCSDVNFGEDFGHFCSATEAFETGLLFEHLYDVARGFVGRADDEPFMVKR